MKVSIIIPVYNTEEYLDECLASVMEQDCADWECILVDDGSTDRSPKICDAWADKDSRFRVFHAENHGVAAARNLGMDMAGGDYLAFVDSDDIAEPNLVSRLVSRAEQSNAELVVGGYSQWKGNEAILENLPVSDATFSFCDQYEKRIINLFENNLIFCPYSKLFSRSLVKRFNIRFDNRYSYGEDLLFNCEILNHIETITTVADSLYRYRRHTQNSLSTRFLNDRFAIDYAQWKALLSLFENKSFLTASVQDYLAKRLWGVVYDGVFLFPRLATPSLSYLRDILSIPEVSFLKSHKDCFQCADWIKKWILRKRALFFWVLFKGGHHR